MTEKELLFDLEAQLERLLLYCKDLQEENSELKTRLEKCKLNLKNEQHQTLEYKEEFERMKIVNAMLGSTENKQMLKVKMNKLIREVDACIVQLKNQ